jgi:hypothetical protein
MRKVGGTEIMTLATISFKCDFPTVFDLHIMTAQNKDHMLHSVLMSGHTIVVRIMLTIYHFSVIY